MTRSNQPMLHAWRAFFGLIAMGFNYYSLTVLPMADAIAILFTRIPFGGIEFTPTWPEHGRLLTLALTSQVAGWLLIGYALPRLPAVETATIILLQPVLTMIWAVLIFSEQPSAIQWVGAAMVLAGVGFVAVSRARRSVVMASAT